MSLSKHSYLPSDDLPLNNFVELENQLLVFLFNGEDNSGSDYSGSG